MPVAAPADRRFRRARLSPGRQRPRWRWVRAAAGVTVALLAAAYAWNMAVDVAGRSPALTVNRIVVSGHSRLSTGDVRGLLDGLEGSNLVTLDLAAWRRKLLASPWVAEADLRRVFPRSVAVTVTEHQAAAIGRVDGALYVIDHTGTIIDELGPNHADLDLPIIDGLATGRSGELLVSEPRARLAGRLLQALRNAPDLAARISQIDVTDVNDAVVVLKDDTALVRIGADHFAERIQSYVDLASYLREHVPDIDSVDLRYGDRVYVRPHGETSTTSGRHKG